MSKTPEEMAEEWAEHWHKDCDYPEEIFKHTIKATKTTFLAGYKAAEEKYKAQIKELETQLENWQHNAKHGDEGL